MAEKSNEEIYAEMKHQLQTHVVTNVFGEEEFKEQFLIVFKTMANILSRTLGPFGSTTMIDQQTNYSVTKDGFHVLSNLRFADTKQNRIYSTLFNISHQMVARVGDGSTSAVVAAYTFLNEMLKAMETSKIRPKKLNDAILQVVNGICDIITKNAIPVTPDNLIETVRNIANIATNENTFYTDMITEIYKKLGANCDINISKSQTFENDVIYEDGVYSNDNYLVDSLYHNRGSVCHLNNCKVMMFDNALEPEIFDMFAMAFNTYCQGDHSTLIVIAPYYDQYLMDKIRKDAEKYVQLFSNAAVINFPMVFIKSNLTKPVQKEMYRDLAALLGATIIQPPDVKEVTGWLNEVAKEASKARAEKRQMSDEYPDKIREFIKTHLGGCEESILGDRASSFKGFTNKNLGLFEKAYHDAEVKLREAEENAIKLDTVDNKVYDAKTRFSKINCKSATIMVGGANRLEIEMNYDAVDDAVKACASAVKYGYNIGCNMAIISAVKQYLDEHKDVDPVERMILEGIFNAFRNVYRTILTNGYDDAKANIILDTCIDQNICYDMNNDDYDNAMKVINSCRTDIEILRGAIAMVGIVLTCNQYISTTLNH